MFKFKSVFFLIVAFSLILSGCSSVPNNAISVLDIGHGTIKQTVDLDTVQIESNTESITLSGKAQAKLENNATTSPSEIKADPIGKTNTLDDNKSDDVHQYFDKQQSTGDEIFYQRDDEFKPEVNSDVFIKNTTKIDKSKNHFFKKPELPPSLLTDNDVFESNSVKNSTNNNSLPSKTDDSKNHYFEKVIKNKTTISSSVTQNTVISLLADDSKSKDPISNKNQPLDYTKTTMVIDTPGPVHLLLNQANEAINIMNYSKANTLLDRAVNISPEEPKLWHTKAKVLLLLKNYTQAKNMALRSNSLQPDNAVIELNLAIIDDAEALLKQ